MDKVSEYLNVVVVNRHYIAYYIGILFIVISHLYMLRTPTMYWHSIFNLIAAALIAYYFINKEYYSGEGKKSEEVKKADETKKPEEVKKADETTKPEEAKA